MIPVNKMSVMVGQTPIALPEKSKTPISIAGITMINKNK
jgi:hypothetical protein